MSAVDGLQGQCPMTFLRSDRNWAEDLVFEIGDLRIRHTGIVKFELFANEVAIAASEVRVTFLGE